MNAEIVKRELRGAQDLIDSFPLLSRLDATTKRTLARSLKEARFEAGQRLYEPVESGMAAVHRFYLIVRGSVRAVKRLQPAVRARRNRRRRRKQRQQQRQLKNMRWRQHRERLQRGHFMGGHDEGGGGSAARGSSSPQAAAAAAPSPMAQAMEGVEEGEDTGEEVLRLGEGDYVGEDSLLKRTWALSDAVALEETVCMYLTEDDFRECLKPLFEDLRQLTRAQERAARRGATLARPSVYQLKGKGSGFGAHHRASLQRRQSSLRQSVWGGESEEGGGDLSVEGEEMEVMGRLSTPRPGLTEGGVVGAADEAEEDLRYGQMGSGSRGSILLASSAGQGDQPRAAESPASGAASVDDRLVAEEDLGAAEARKDHLSHFIQLRAVSGPLRRQVFLADTDFVTIGRRGSSIEINDRALSQLHCMIEYRDGSYWLSDMVRPHRTNPPPPPSRSLPSRQQQPR